MFQKKLIPPQGEWDLVVDATQQVGRHAALCKRELAIELLPFPFSFIGTLDDMERFLDDVGLDNVKATVDISHFWLMRIPPEDLARRLKGRVAHVHVSDCDGPIMATCPRDAATPRSGSTFRRSATPAFPAPRRSSSNLPPTPAVCLVAEAHGSALDLMRKAGVHA